jgi:glycosyltransferase involved in cell wall biosynthesis
MKISIIIPVYGVEKYIAHCARSLFIQKGADLEFIFVNDATKDSSIEILKEVISKEYPFLKKQITIIDKDFNEGLPQARKTGVSIATGDYIMHCDSDDWLAKDAVKTISNKITETSADIIYYNYYISKDGQNEVIREMVFSTPIEYAKAIMSFSPLSSAFCWNKVIKRELYNKVFEWPVQNMHEDMALMPQIIIQSQTLVSIDSPLYYYRVSSSSSMSLDLKRNKEKKIQSLKNQLLLINFLEKLQVVNTFKLQYQQLISRCAYIEVFFNWQSIPINNYYKSLWKYPIFLHFDVSVRKQIQSRAILSLYYLRIKYSILLRKFVDRIKTIDI